MPNNTKARPGQRPARATSRHETANSKPFTPFSNPTRYRPLKEPAIVYNGQRIITMAPVYTGEDGKLIIDLTAHYNSLQKIKEIEALKERVFPGWIEKKIPFDIAHGFFMEHMIDKDHEGKPDVQATFNRLALQFHGFLITNYREDVRNVSNELIEAFEQPWSFLSALEHYLNDSSKDWKAAHCISGILPENIHEELSLTLKHINALKYYYESSHLTPAEDFQEVIEVHLRHANFLLACNDYIKQHQL